MNEILISIIVVKYKSEKYLENCIKSIKKSLKDGKIEIVVVDNDKINIGYGAGLNKGARIAKGKYLLLLNPDTVMLKNAIEEMYLFLERNPEVAILGPKIFNNEEKDRQLSFCRFPGPLTALFVYSPLKSTLIGKMFWNYFTYGYAKKNIVNDQPICVDEVSGAAMMIRKSVFEKIHGFDENVFMYFEENDLCRRVQRLGYKIYFDPKAEIIHYGGKSNQDIETSNNYFRKSRDYFFKKHFGMILGNLLNFFIASMEFIIKTRRSVYKPAK